MGANCYCGVRQKEAFSVSHQLSWQPFKSFECRRRLHAVQNKQEEQDAGSPKAKVVSGFDEWDMKSDTAQPTTGRLKRNTKWISLQIFCERLLYHVSRVSMRLVLQFYSFRISRWEESDWNVREVTVASPSCRPGASCGESGEFFSAINVAKRSSADSPQDAPGRQLGEATVTTLTDIWGCIEQPWNRPDPSWLQGILFWRIRKDWLDIFWCKENSMFLFYLLSAIVAHQFN